MSEETILNQDESPANVATNETPVETAKSIESVAEVTTETPAEPVVEASVPETKKEPEAPASKPDPIITEPESDDTSADLDDTTAFEDDLPTGRFGHARKEDLRYLRDKHILSKIKDDDLMEYLRLEQKMNEMNQKAKEVREKRIMTTLILAISLLAIVSVVYLLKDSPTILTNILYITGIVAGIWFFRNPRQK